MSKHLKSVIYHPLSHFQKVIAFLTGFGALFFGYSDSVNRQWDFPVYYLAAQAMADHQNPYDPSALQKISDSQEETGYGGGLPYLYPPHLARIFSLFSSIPFFTASFLWMILKCIALESILFSSFSLMRIPTTPMALILGNFAALFYRPVGLDFSAGNIATIEFALILGGLAAWSRHRYKMAGLLTILGGSIKGTTLLITLYPLHLRDKRYITALTLSAALIGMFSLLDWRNILNFFSFFQSPLWQQTWDEQVQSFYNCSATTVILRTFSDTYFAVPLIHIPILANILIPLFPIGIFTIMAFVIQRASKQNCIDPANGIILSMILCGLLLIPPRLAGYTLIWTLFPVLQISLLGWKNKSILAFIILIIGLTLIQLNLPPNHIPSGISQLLIDKDFFGLLCFFLASAFLSLRYAESAKKMLEREKKREIISDRFFSADNE